MMKVVAVKMNDEPISMKIVYEKNGSYYIRSGADGFSRGEPIKCPVKALLNKWGFREVINPPEFRDSDEIVDSITGFGQKSDGTIEYYPGR